MDANTKPSAQDIDLPQQSIGAPRYANDWSRFLEYTQDERVSRPTLPSPKKPELPPPLPSPAWINEWILWSSDQQPPRIHTDVQPTTSTNSRVASLHDQMSGEPRSSSIRQLNNDCCAKLHPVVDLEPARPFVTRERRQMECEQDAETHHKHASDTGIKYDESCAYQGQLLYDSELLQEVDYPHAAEVLLSPYLQEALRILELPAQPTSYHRHELWQSHYATPQAQLSLAECGGEWMEVKAEDGEDQMAGDCTKPVIGEYDEEVMEDWVNL